MGRIRLCASWGLLCGCPLQPQTGLDVDTDDVTDAPKRYKILIVAQGFLREDWAGAHVGLTMVRGEAGARVSTHEQGLRGLNFLVTGSIQAFTSLPRCGAKENGYSGGLKAVNRQTLKMESDCHEKIVA